MKVKKRKRVLYEFRDARGAVTAEFIRIPKDRPAPGFSHRVHLTGYLGFVKDWLSDEYRPNWRTAHYYDKHVEYYEKHAAQPQEVKP